MKKERDEIRGENTSKLFQKLFKEETRLMKKLLAALMALMMLVAPVASYAEGMTDDPLMQAWETAERTETTLTIHDLNGTLLKMLGLDDSVVSAVNDVLDALAIDSYVQGDEGGFTIRMKDKALLGIAGRMDGDTVLLESDLLGGVVSYNAEDEEALEENLLRVIYKLSGMTDAEIEKTLASYKETLTSAWSQAYLQYLETLQKTAQLGEKELMTQVLSADWTGVMDVLAAVMQTAETAEVTEQPDDCDAVTTVMTFTVTNEQLAKISHDGMVTIMQIPFVKECIDAAFSYSAAMSAEYSTDAMTAEDLQTAMDEVIAELADEKLLAEDMKVYAYLDETGNLVKVVVDVKADNGEYEPIPVLVTVAVKGEQMVVKTECLEDTVTFTLKFVDEDMVLELTVAEKGTVSFTATLTLSGDVTDETQVITGDLDIVINSDDMIIAFGGVVKLDNRLDGANAVRKLDVTIDFMTMDVLTITAESKTCAAQEPISADKATDIGKMDADTFQTWATKVVTNVQNLPMTIVMSLPDSVLMLLMGN